MKTFNETLIELHKQGKLLNAYQETIYVPTRTSIVDDIF